jgi:alkylhydroperoxidase family enzyme
MLPEKLRNRLFDSLSVKTMRYVTSVPGDQATGLTKRVYDMIRDDFFINGSLTSRSRVPELLAAIWTAGRETMLVDDHLDRTTKEAICAVLSEINACPYCGDMLISLVHAGDQSDAAGALYETDVSKIADPVMRDRLVWVEAVGTPGRTNIPPCPFTPEQLPEVLGSLMAMADINRYSHVVMDGSPVNAPLGLQGVALRAFGVELRATKRRSAVAGRALSLLPAADLPDDLQWARSNPVVADALARWTNTVERQTRGVIPDAVRACVTENLRDWNNERMPISLSWVEPEVAGLTGRERALARLALVLTKAPYQVTDKLVQPLVDGNEERFIRTLAWCSFTAARRYAQVLAEKTVQRVELATA